MMNMLEEAILYATVLHQGKVRKFTGIPFILHPMEVAQILSTMTDDQEVITAGILHDVVEDTDGTLEEIEKRFGKRVAYLVASESEKEHSGEAPKETWKRRKEESIKVLKNSEDVGVKMLWLADKLANVRSLARAYSERGDDLWKVLHQSDPEMQRWYYRTIAENVELSLNKTGAFKELIKHVNFIWPGTFDSEKARYRKYKEVSLDGCRLVGKGAKGDVYRYDDELVIKVFNQNNNYRDVEQEIAMSRRAFILGMPSVISFGIVSVGDRYGAMYELVDSETISRHVARNPGQEDGYAKIMAGLAHEIHEITVSKDDCFPEAAERIRGYVNGGVAYENEALAKRCLELVESLAESDHLIHGDFHTGNVFLQNGEPLLIDMDRVSVGHFMFEISDLYYFYVILGEDDPDGVERFMGFSSQIARKFMDDFLKFYFRTDDEEKLAEIKEKASIIGYARLIRKLRKKGMPTEKDGEKIKHCMDKIKELTGKWNTLDVS